jgi:integrase
MGALPPDRRAVSYDVRLWKTRATRRAKHTSYRVRWSVAGEEQGESFTTSGLAASFRSKLVTATREGVAFDIATGWPVTMDTDYAKKHADQDAPAEAVVTWYSHAVEFVDAVWPSAAPGHRKNIAEALAHVTPAFFRPDATGRPEPALIRRALYAWSFDARNRTPMNPKRRGDPVLPRPPEDIAGALAWLEVATVPLAELGDTENELVRRALDLLGKRINGRPAAPSTVAWKRSAFYSCIEYAIERKRLTHNPVGQVKRRAVRSAGGVVDRRVVINHDQGRALLAAVAGQGRSGKRMVAFFGCIYYSALRPEEANDLSEADIDLPDSDDDWGWFTLAGANPETGSRWTDSGEREARELKHRAEGDTRPVPIPPPLVALLRAHLTEFPPAPDGKIFTSPRGGPVRSNTYGRVWKAAREAALTPAQVTSPLAATPYDLRHACVSTWLNGMVQGTQVAEWAGHSVAVLYRVYAKCIDGDVDTQLRRIEAALGITRPGDPAADPADSVPSMVREPPETAPPSRTPPDTTGSGS